jgi:hypothetical protein
MTTQTQTSEPIKQFTAPTTLALLAVGAARAVLRREGVDPNSVDLPQAVEAAQRSLCRFDLANEQQRQLFEEKWQDIKARTAGNGKPKQAAPSAKTDQIALNGIVYEVCHGPNVQTTVRIVANNSEQQVIRAGIARSVAEFLAKYGANVSVHKIMVAIEQWNSHQKG